MKRGRSGEATLRVVLDTNVYVSAFNYPDGSPFRVWLKGVQGDYNLLLSPFIVHEVADILRVRFAWSEPLVRRQVKLLAKTGELIAATSIPSVIKEDPSDNHILACAVAGKANFIVSEDRHLRRLKRHGSIAIVRPIDFLRSLPGR